MKVLAVPVSDKDSASCRIRYHIFLKSLPDECKVERYRAGAKGDVLYIQKLITPEAKKIAKHAHSIGLPIVYDRDDFRRRWDEEGYNEILDRCAAVTTDTGIRADLISSHTKTPVFVVPDCLDYDVQPENRIDIRESIGSVVTYGRWKGVEAAAPYFAKSPVPAFYFCDRRIDALKKYRLKEWKREKFIKRLRKYDVAILAHKDVWTAQYKSNNRLLVAMSIGMPVLAVHSPAFDETLAAVGHPELIVKSPREVKEKLRYLESPDTRRKISDDLFKYAWDNYCPRNSGAKLYEVFRYATERTHK